MGYTQISFAEKINVSFRTLQNWEQGIGISDKTLKILYASSPDEFKYYIAKDEGNFSLIPNDDFFPENVEEASENLYWIDILNVKVSAGKGYVNSEFNKTGIFPIRSEDLYPYADNTVKVIHVIGDSMRPTLFDGDYVMCAIGTIGNDGIYVLNVNGELRVKRLQFQLDGSVKVISDNPLYSPETFRPDGEGDDNVFIVGRVIKRIGNI
jgi:phage repressor protein C with HTH and peptisase S24 domain